jgi:transcriptional regulator with XRE-family HTH domain
MKREYDFSKAVRGEFYRKGAALCLPIEGKEGKEMPGSMSPGKIARLLEALPLTQTQVAEHLGVSLGLVSHWKSGYTKISPDHAEELRLLDRDAKATRRSAKDEEERTGSDQPSGPQSYGEWLAEQLDAIHVTQAKFATLSDVSPITISNLINGKNSPQQGTRQKIEKALSTFPSQRKSRGETPSAPKADPNEPVVGISFRKDEISQAPNQVGVYVIHDGRGHPTYVGKGNLRSELTLYSGRTWAASDHAAAKFSYAVLGNDQEADKIETILIKFMADSLLVNTKKRVSVAVR